MESALPAGIGLNVSLPAQQLPMEFMLFGEDASRVVISCDPAKLTRIQEVAEEYGVVADILGETGSDRVEITIGEQTAISESMNELRECYEEAMEKSLRTAIFT